MRNMKSSAQRIRFITSALALLLLARTGGVQARAARALGNRRVKAVCGGVHS